MRYFYCVLFLFIRLMCLIELNLNINIKEINNYLTQKMSEETKFNDVYKENFE